MMCYKDMTFCQFYKECKTPCYRSLTDDVLKGAERFQLPLSMFTNKPKCFEEKNESYTGKQRAQYES